MYNLLYSFSAICAYGYHCAMEHYAGFDDCGGGDLGPGTAPGRYHTGGGHAGSTQFEENTTLRDEQQ